MRQGPGNSLLAGGYVQQADCDLNSDHGFGAGRRRAVSASILALFLATPSHAASQELRELPLTADVDGFGCEITPRPDEMTFDTFRDAWRSVAADKLYDLRRYEAVLEAGNCTCKTLRPEWALIETEFDALGFADGPPSTYDAWVNELYFPVIKELRDRADELCGEGS